jgi:hypothetical protein
MLQVCNYVWKTEYDGLDDRDVQDPFCKEGTFEVIIGIDREAPIILNTMYLDWQKDKSPPFYLSLGMNGLRLNNFMLDSGAFVNFMSLKVMEQVGLKTT